VGVTAVIAGIRGERLGGRDWLSLAVLGIGLILLSLTANAESAVRVSHLAQWVILSCGIVPVAIGLLALRMRGRRSSLVLAAAAGLAWTGVAVAARGVSAHRIDLQLLAHPLVWTILIQGVIGTVFFALALQRGSVTAVTAMTFVLEMVFPSAIGLWLFGDTVAHGHGLSAVVGFVLAIGGTLSLMRFAES
jgi:drug/metabolite transporter (DMT)-like permease